MITFVRLQKIGLLLCSLMLGLPALLPAQWGKPPMPRDTFHSYNICFPADIEIRDCAPPPPPSILKDELGECDMLAVHIKENVYRVSGDDCYKIFRTYSVINWCAFKEACGPQNLQVFVVDRDAPVFDGVLGSGVCLLVRDNDKDKYPEVYYSKDLVADPEERIVFPKTCLPNAHPVWQYTQIIKVYDEIAPVVSAAAPTAPFATAPGNCRASVRINFQASDNCTGPITLVSVQLASGTGGQLRDPANFIPGWLRQTHVRNLGSNRYEARLDSLGEGTYELGVLFRDDCGNQSLLKRIPFEVRDTTPPVPICHHGLSASLMANGPGEGMVILRAMDFVASPIYDCNGQGPQVSPFNPRQTLVREYSLNLPGQTPKPDQDSLVFDCSFAGDSVLVELHAWDRRMNHAYCLTYVKIQDNAKLCARPSSGVTIAGFVRTEMGVPMPGVEIQLQGAGLQRSALTGADGAYSFDGLEPGGAFTLTPVYNGDIMQGLESRDLLVLQDHLLGMKALASPYQRIAADINRSAYLSIADLITLQRLILGHYTDYSVFRSWRFVPKDYIFPDPDDPWMETFPESIQIPALSAESNPDYDFIAIKAGDLNYNAMDPNGGAAALRSGSTSRALMLEEHALQPGALLEIPLSLSAGGEVLGLSAHLALEPAFLRVREIIPGILTQDQIYLHDDGRSLSVAGILPSGSGKRNEILFTLIAEVATPGLLSDAIRQEVRNGIQAANLRDGRDEPLLLTFSPADRPSVNHVGLRFAPNPLQESGELFVNVAQACELTLTLVDIQGRVVHTAKLFAEEGELRWMIPGRLLPAQGVYFARLESSWGVETIKIVKAH